METVRQILWNGDAIVRNSCLEIPQFLNKICDALCIGESPGSRALQLPTKGGAQGQWVHKNHTAGITENLSCPLACENVCCAFKNTKCQVPMQHTIVNLLKP